MNMENRSLCEDQHQALNSYLDALLSPPEEMSTLGQATPAAALIPDAPAAVADTRLKCFVFTVAGLKLALPLARVTESVEFSGCDGKPVPPLLLGHLVYTEGRHVPVLDSARILLPGGNAVAAYRWLVIVDDGSYALACDSVEPHLEVAPAAVRWRTPSTQRRWLAGTLLQHRCALLDADEIYVPKAENTL